MNTSILLFVYIANMNLLLTMGRRKASLKPLSLCCDIPELGEPQHLDACNRYDDVMGPCVTVECIFEHSNFLNTKHTLKKEVYKDHLISWAEQRVEWTTAIERVIQDCVDKEPRQYLNISCKAYDVYTCTSIALLKKCPPSAWKCETLKSGRN